MMFLKKITQLDNVRKFDLSIESLSYTVNNEVFITDLLGNMKFHFIDDNAKNIIGPPHLYDNDFFGSYEF